MYVLYRVHAGALSSHPSNSPPLGLRISFLLFYIFSRLLSFSINMVSLHDRGRKLSPAALRQIRYPLLIAVAGTADVGLLFLNRSLLISTDSLNPNLSAIESQGLR